VTMRGLALVLALALCAAAALSQAVTIAAAAAPPAPVNLRVLGGEETWHADNDLRLDWEETAPGTVTAVRYRVRDESGVAVLDSRLPSDPFRIDHIRLPRPGTYSAEVWLEGPAGEQGPAATVSLRFDDARPGAVLPLLPSTWIGADQVPQLRLTHPAGPVPISGLRGYAVSVDLDPDAVPCRSQDRCTQSETDLGGGPGEDSMPLPHLPEGTVHVRAVAVSGSGKRSASPGNGLLRVDLTPPSVSVRGAPSEWVRHAVTVTAVAVDRLSGMAGGSESGAITALSVDGAVPAVAAGGEITAQVAGEGVHAVSAHARDVAGNVSEDTAGRTVVRIDRSPPRVAFAASLDPSDPELLAASIGDSLSGPDPSRGSIAVRPRGSHRQFSPLPTTIEGERLLARWNSDRYPPGQYEFVATASDRAGNVTHSMLRTGGMTMVLPAPLKAPTRLLAGFGGSSLVWHRCDSDGSRRRCRREVIEAFEQRPARRTVPYGRGLTVGGLLTSASGAPLGAHRVELIEVFGEGTEAFRRTRELSTAADGSFLARLAPGPSRRVEFAFAGSRTLSEARARPATLTVRTGVKVRASATVASVGGRPLVFSGVVEDAAAIPANGKSVELQFRLPGLPWTEFRALRTDAEGRFRYPYRFSDDDSRGVRFQFRAFVPAEGVWPYAPAASSPFVVRGR
jgi:hypothetical protein